MAQQGQIVQDKDGNRLRLVGMQWVPVESQQEEGARMAREQTASEVGPGEAFLIGAGRALGGGWMYGGDESYRALQEQRPWSTGAGALVPALAAGVVTGGATAGMGLGARLGAGAASEAALGALGDPEAPLQSAGMGAAFGGVGAALPDVIAAGRRGAAALPGQARESMTGVAGMLPLPQRMQARILGIAGDAPGGQPRVPGGVGTDGPHMENATGNELYRGSGWMSSQEARDLGITMTPGQALYQDAPDIASRNAAMAMKRGEDLARSDPILGARFTEIADQQKAWLTDRVAAELGLPAGVRFDTSMIGDQFERVGGMFDAIGRDLGTVPITKSALTDLEEIQSYAGPVWAGKMAQVHNSLVDALTKNNDVLTFEDWQHVKNRIDRALMHYSSQGDAKATSSFADYADRLQEAMVEHAAPEVRQALDDARRQYRVLKLLTRATGTIDEEGMVNARQFASNLRTTPSRYKDARDDQFVRAVDLVSRLQARPNPSSGTAERLLAAAARGAPGAVGGSLGAAAIIAGGNALFGN